MRRSLLTLPVYQLHSGPPKYVRVAQRVLGNTGLLAEVHSRTPMRRVAQPEEVSGAQGTANTPCLSVAHSGRSRHIKPVVHDGLR